MWGTRKCPKCKADTHLIHRIHRSFWMKLVPNSKTYRCQKCKTRFILVGETIVSEKRTDS